MPPPSPTALPVVPFAPSAPTMHVGREPLAALELHDVVRLDLDRDALAHLHPALARRVEQERVEPPPLRHPDDRLPATARTTASP